MSEKYYVGPSPHILGAKSISSIMWDVIIALIPVTLAAVVFFGISAVLVLLVATITAMVVEALVVFKNLKPASLLGDGSAAVTGLLLGLIVPPSVPLWLVAIGSAVAILLGKQVFGGIGKNIFNPALVGRAFIGISWAALMLSRWHLPISLDSWFKPIADFATGATPLQGAQAGLMEVFIGNIGGSLGETSALAILLGAAWLLIRGHIDWRIPGGYIVTAAVFVLLAGRGNDPFWYQPLWQIMAGGLLFGAVYMATDMVTSPVTKLGRIIFGAGCGFITIFVRLFASAPEGVTYAILFMNALVPLIDRYTVPRTFGEVKS